MPMLDVSEMNRSLDNDYGATHGPNAPDEHEFIMFSGDPFGEDAVELDGTSCPGYAAVTVSNDAGWPAASDGRKLRSVTIPDPTDEWDLSATHWGLRNPDTGGVADASRFANPIVVPSAGTIPPVIVEVRYGNDEID